MNPREPSTDRLTAKQIVRWINKTKGEQVSLPTVHRWMLRGVNGEQLPASRVGGKHWTVLVDDLKSFLDRCNNRRQGASPPPVTPKAEQNTRPRTPPHRRQQITSASEALRERLNRHKPSR